MPNQHKFKPTSIRFSQPELTRLKKYCESHGKAIATVVKEAVRQYLDENQGYY
jgi:predicted DNA-binding protein